MNRIETYLLELGHALHTRGRFRRRALAECRNHLTDAAGARGEAEAVRRFGSAIEVAAAIDAETAARRGSWSTVAAVVGVIGVAGSTLALVNSSDAGTAVVWWAVIFFGAAQAAAVATLLAVVQAVELRRASATPADLRLLGRRNLSAIALALITEFSAGAAITGYGATAALLAGPVLTVPALLLATRAWWLARQLDRRGARTVVDRRFEGVRPLAATSAAAVLLAYAWNSLDHGDVTSSVGAAAVELTLVLVGFVVLGGALGVRPVRATAR